MNAVRKPDPFTVLNNQSTTCVNSFGQTALNSFSMVCLFFDFQTCFSHQILQVASVSDLNESDDGESHGPEGNVTGKITYSLNIVKLNSPASYQMGH